MEILRAEGQFGQEPKVSDEKTLILNNEELKEEAKFVETKKSLFPLPIEALEEN